MLTAVGAVGLGRSHGYCTGCGQPGFAADGLLGLDGWLTARARGMASLAGIHGPFRRAERLLAELAGWSVDAETVRRLCHAEAARAAKQRAGRAALPEAFAQAPGDHEWHSDAGQVDTPEGYRDVKVAVAVVRPRAAPATPDDYQQRDLPAPAARAVVAAVEGAGAFAARCRGEADRLGVPPGAALTVLGDGAEWLWKLAAEQFPGACGCLDIYHASEHVAQAARRVRGEATAEARAQAEGGRGLLLADGYWGVQQWVGQLAQAMPADGDGAALAEVLNYFAGHKGRLNCALRLCRGQAIGSGVVEGTIKQRVNLRLKRTGARWLADHVGPFVELLALADGPEWAEYWAAQAS